MAMFRSLSNLGGYVPRPIEYPKTRPTYEYDFDAKTGKKYLKRTGETNVYAMIQESKDDNTPQKIAARMQRGDMTALGEVVDGFLDTLSYPKTFMESQNVMLKMQNLYDGLDVKQKAEYGNDINVFIKSLNTKMDEKLQANAQAQREKLIQQQQQPATQQPTGGENNAQQ